MNEIDEEVRRVTSVELLDAAIWREINSDDPQPPAAFLQALSCLLGRWLLIRSVAPFSGLLRPLLINGLCSEGQGGVLISVGVWPPIAKAVTKVWPWFGRNG